MEREDDENCPMHRIPLVKRSETDWYCLKCEEEQEDPEDREREEREEQEYQKYKEQEELSYPISEKIVSDKDDTNFIAKYSPLIHNITKASQGACKSMSTFLISCGLANCRFYDDMGSVQASLSFFNIAPPGSYKTPLIELADSAYDKVFKDSYNRKHSTFSPSGLMMTLNLAGKKNPLNYNGIIIRDEVSNLAKQARQQALNDLWENLSEVYEGKLRPKETAKRGREEFPENIYMPMWFAGTELFFKYVNEEFWDQGFALRCQWIKPEDVPFQELHQGQNDSLQWKDEMFTELREMSKIEIVYATNEFMQLYNEKRRIIHEKLSKSLGDGIEKDSFLKHPEMMLKFSMIYAAARKHWVKTNDCYALTLDVEDLENALTALEEYRGNMIYAYNKFNSMTGQNRRIDRIDNLIQRVKVIIEQIMQKPELLYEYHEVVEANSIGVDQIHLEASHSKEGKYVSRSEISRRSGGLIPNDLNTIFASMEEREHIEWLKGVVESGVKKPLQLIRLL